MNKSAEVLSFLIPQGGWVLYGEDYEGIQFLECQPITKAEFEAGFAQYDSWKSQRDAEAKAKREALLERLGITDEEAKLLAQSL